MIITTRICTQHRIDRRLSETGTIIRCDECGVTWHIAHDVTIAGKRRVYSKYTYHQKIHVQNTKGGRKAYL